MIRRLCFSAALAVLPLAKAAAEAVKPAPAEAETSLHLKVPLFSEAFADVPAAMVEGDVIPIAEVTDALASMHQGRHDEKGGKPDAAARVDVMPVLDRLIDVRLFAVEARNMGMDTLPEYEKSVSEWKATTGQEILKRQAVREVTGDPAVVERLFKESVQRWTVRSVLFANESDAIKLKAAVDGGAKFQDVAKQAVADGKAKGGEGTQPLTRQTALPHLVTILEKMKDGQVTPPTRLNEGWAVLELEKTEFPEDAKALEKAQSIARVEAQKAALKKYYEEISKRFAVIDQKLLKALDFEKKKPGMAALKKDKRVVARIKGGKDVTVGEFAAALEAGFYHGMDTAGAKKANRQKADVFDGLLAARIIPLEVTRLGIEQTPEFKRRLDGYRNGLLFSTFLTKVIAPKVQVNDETMRKHYEEHRKDYTYPGFYRLEALAFGTAKEAQAAVDKLASGTDFKWLNANSAQIPPGERKVKFEGLLAETGLPEELAKALSGTRPGDYRLYAGPASQYYAVRVAEVLPPQEQPYEEVQGKLREKLFYDAVNASVKDWAGKLRKASDVKVFITRIGS